MGNKWLRCCCRCCLSSGNDSRNAFAGYWGRCKRIWELICVCFPFILWCLRLGAYGIVKFFFCVFRYHRGAKAAKANHGVLLLRVPIIHNRWRLKGRQLQGWRRAFGAYVWVRFENGNLWTTLRWALRQFSPFGGNAYDLTLGLRLMASVV